MRWQIFDLDGQESSRRQPEPSCRIGFLRINDKHLIAKGAER
jgi:hypothetical protein